MFTEGLFCASDLPGLGRIYRWKSRPCLLSIGHLTQCATLGSWPPFFEPQASLAMKGLQDPRHICTLVGVRHGPAEPQDCSWTRTCSPSGLGVLGPSFIGVGSGQGVGSPFCEVPTPAFAQHFGIAKRLLPHRVTNSSWFAQNCPGY